ncbi:MAG TPA: alpha/beta hydrolase [Acidimicrobiales bacterium]|nr:alpha/beta hydrolase [Acidimicrobiales bacterium]
MPVHDESDEFSLLRQNAEDAGLPWSAPPVVRRASVRVDDHHVSAIVWGDGPARAVLLHGGAQNAHTWDTVALALQRPVVAVDLPGHGRSDWRDDGDYDVQTMADTVAETVRTVAPSATTVIGIGLGAPVGLLAADRIGPAVERLVLIDSASGIRTSATPDAPATSQAAARVAAFTSHHRFASLDEMIVRTLAYSPGRVSRAVRRGVLHNSRQQDDGSWSWRWDPRQQGTRDYAFDETAAALARFVGPVLLVRGELSDIVTDDLAAAFMAVHPDTELVTLTGAGHAVQGDRPVELAQVLLEFSNR